ncbi:MAG: group 1 truncated hemoglobin [Trueperaceae bacterium]|nr:group 1 truncated hemoglobin [Trueperaceae bacterium]
MLSENACVGAADGTCADAGVEQELAMTYPQPSLYARIGGAEVVADLVDAFYQRVLADPELAPFFAKTDADKLRAMQREFFSVALGGPVTYFGRPLAYAHRGRGIERRHLQRFTEHLLATLEGQGLEDRDVHDVVDRINVYSSDILGGHGTSG